MWVVSNLKDCTGNGTYTELIVIIIIIIIVIIIIIIIFSIIIIVTHIILNVSQGINISAEFKNCCKCVSLNINIQNSINMFYPFFFYQNWT